MTKFSKQINIGASQGIIWSVMADLGGIYKFNPNVSRSYYTSAQKKGIGAGRVCELRPAGKVEEIATAWEEGESFTLEIIPLEKTPPIKNVYAHLDLQSVGPNSTDVTVSMEYETKLGFIGRLLNSLMIQGQMEKSMEQLLEGLKLNIEQGHEIDTPAELKKLLEFA